MEKRQERMLEEVLKLPGNNACADCRSTAPRWASVSLGIFICVSCASIHRKMGTHTSRVKSVTLDTWTREQITTMRNIGNTASNAKYNPDERLHPPPSNVHSDERDSEMEKFIRRKYEQKAFMPGARAGAAPTSLNRARESKGISAATSPWMGRENKRNPELNDIVVPSPAEVKEKALPGLPESGSRRGSAATGSALAPPRLRPSPTPSRSSSIQNLVNAGGIVGPAGPQLIDINGASSSTLPLQLATTESQFQANYSMGNSQQPSQLGMSAFSTAPSPIMPGTNMQQQALSPINMPGNSYFGQLQQPQQYTSTPYLQPSSSFTQQQTMLNIPNQQMMQQQFSASPGGTYTMQSTNPFAASSPGAMPYSPGGMQMAGGQGNFMGMSQGPGQIQMGMQGQTQAPQWGMQGMQMQGQGQGQGGWQGQQSYQYHT